MGKKRLLKCKNFTFYLLLKNRNFIVMCIKVLWIGQQYRNMSKEAKVILLNTIADMNNLK